MRADDAEARFFQRLREENQPIQGRRPASEGWRIIWISVFAAVFTVAGVWSFVVIMRGLFA